MNFVERKREDVSLFNINKIFQSDVRQLLMASVKGRVFIEDDQQRLMGCFPMDRYDVKQGTSSFESSPALEDGKNFKEQLPGLVQKHPYYGIFPVVDQTGKITKFITAREEMWGEDMLVSLGKLAYLADKGVDIGFYFTSASVKRVALWGCNKLSLTLALELKKYAELVVLGIFDSIKNKPYIKEDILNYPVDITFVESMNDTKAVEPEMLLICDWTMRQAGKVIDFTRIEYVPHLLKSEDFYLAMNRSMFCRVQEELADKGVPYYSVRIPTEDDLDIKEKKNDKLTEKMRFEYFAKETGYPLESKELMDFNSARQALTKAVIKRDGGVYFQDYSSRDFNFIGGKRFLPNLPAKTGPRIFLVGACLVSALFSKDDQTLAYFLQELVKEKGENYVVVPLGIPNDADRYYFHEALCRENPVQGDIAVLLDQTFRCSDFDIDSLSVFKEVLTKYGQNFYYDFPVHFGKDMAKVLARFIYTNCVCSKIPPVRLNTKKDAFISKRTEGENNSKRLTALPFSGNVQLEKYKKWLETQKVHHKPIVGAIVMNCNPFTLGHKYLIETAKSQVDFLYIFVVEEDKSIFAFKDRLKMVELGTSHLKNIKVLPYGSFIISSLTFSSYFEKANLKGNTVDTTLDVETFARQIAPCLDITVRFVGEEPLDPVTWQYNQSMKNILPQYGIELREIPRKEEGGEVISASRVRGYLQEKKWDELAKIVPNTTYEYLKNME